MAAEIQSNGAGVPGAEVATAPTGPNGPGGGSLVEQPTSGVPELPADKYSKAVMRRQTPLPDGEADRTAKVERDRLGVYQAITAGARRGDNLSVWLIGDGKKHHSYVRGKVFAPDTAREGEYTLNQPPEIRAVDAPPDEVDEKTTDLKFWRKIHVTAGKWLPREVDATTVLPGMAIEEDILASQAGRRYAIGVEAQALSREEIIKLELETKRDQKRAADRFGEADQEDLAAELNDKLQDLIRARQNGQGYWRYNLVIGADSVEELDDLARKVETSAHDPGLLQTFAADEGPHQETKDDALRSGKPSTGPSDLVYHAIPLPRGDRDIPGIPKVVRPSFPSNLKNGAELEAHPEYAVVMGEVVDDYDNAAGPAAADARRATEHGILAGGSGQGKTKTAETWVEQMVRLDHKARQEHPDALPMGFLILTPKVGNDFVDLGYRLAPYDRKVIFVNVNDLDEVPVGNDPIHRLPGETPGEAEARAVTATTVAQQASGAHDAEIGRAVQQYMGEGALGSEYGNKQIVSIYELSGVNRYTGNSQYDADLPDPSYGQTVSKTIKDVTEHDFKGDAAKLPEFMGSYLGMIHRAIENYTDFYHMSPDEVRSSVIIVNYSRVREPMARALMMNNTFDFVTYMMEEEQRTGSRAAPGLPAYGVIVDEINEVAEKGSTAEKTMGDTARRARSAGVAARFLAQLMDAVPDQVIANTQETIILNLGHPDDIEAAGKKLGLRPDQHDMIPKLERGEALFKAPGSGDAVRVMLTPPPDIPEAVIVEHLHGPEALVDAGERTMYTLREHREADELIASIPGQILETEVQFETIIEALGADMMPPAHEKLEDGGVYFFKRFRDGNFKNFKDDEVDGRKVVACAIEKLVETAVLERKNFFFKSTELPDGTRIPPKFKSLGEAVSKISKRVNLQIDGQEVPEELKPGEPVTAFEGLVSEKGPAHIYLNRNLDLINQRAAVAAGISELSARMAAIPKTEDGIPTTEAGLKAHKEIASKIVKHSAEALRLDKELEDYTAITFDAQTGKATQHDDHPHVLTVRAMQVSTLADLLLPPGDGGYTLDRGIGITVDEVVEQNKRNEWLKKIDNIFAYYDMDPRTKEFLRAEYRTLIDKTIKNAKEKFEAEKKKALDAQAAAAPAAPAPAPAPAPNNGDSDLRDAVAALVKVQTAALLEKNAENGQQQHANNQDGWYSGTGYM